MTSLHPLPFRSDVQGLRAIAILLVVFGHAGFPLFPGGFVGVDVFFVISGYLITGMLLREQAATGTIRLDSFFSRRLKRLLPNLVLMLVLTSAAASILLSDIEVREQMRSAIYAATWTSNLFFAFSQTQYFAELTSKDFFLHTWSLGLEEQYYLFWPLLLIMIGYPLRRFSQTISQFTQFLALALLFVGSLYLCWFWSNENALWSFYLMPARIWQFAMGAMVFAFHRHYETENRTYGKWVGFTGLLIIVASAILLGPNINYPGLWALLPSVGATMLLAAGLSEQPSGASKLLSHPLLVWIGDRSYAWYLWHWPILVLGFAFGSQDQPLMTLTLVMLSLITASVTYRWVEVPFWRGQFSDTPPRHAILASLLVMAVALGSNVIHFNYLLPSDDQQFSQTAKPEGVVGKSYHAAADIPEIYRAGCDSWYFNADVKPCVTGNPQGRRTVILVGDSIGAQWYSAIQEIFKADEWRVEVYTKSACPMVDERYYYKRIGKNYDICDQWRNTLLDRLASREVEAIFLGSSETYPFTRSQWINGTVRVVERLRGAGKHIFVIPGTPGIAVNGPGCLARWRKEGSQYLEQNGAICSRPVEGNIALDVAGYLDEALAMIPNAELLDLNDLVCPGGLCSALNSQGVVVYRDSHHLTDSFVRFVTPQIRDRLASFEMISDTSWIEEAGEMGEANL